MVEPKGGALTLEVLRVRVTLAEDEGPPPPPTGGRRAPNPTSKGEPSGEKRPAPSTPSAGGAEKSSQNAKKRRLNSKKKCFSNASGYTLVLLEVL